MDLGRVARMWRAQTRFEKQARTEADDVEQSTSRTYAQPKPAIDSRDTTQLCLRH